MRETRAFSGEFDLPKYKCFNINNIAREKEVSLAARFRTVTRKQSNKPLAISGGPL
jgi:hypothetical protein